MKRRRTVLRSGFVVGSVLLAGCPAGTSSQNGSSPTRTPVSWETAFQQSVSEAEMAILRETPITVGQVSTRADVKTAIGVLAWSQAAAEIPSSTLSNLERLAQTAGEVRDVTGRLSSLLEEALALVEKMKEHPLPVWSAATMASPSLSQFETGAQELTAELQERADQAAEIQSVTTQLVSQLRELRTEGRTDYTRLTRALEAAASNYEQVIQEAADIGERITRLREISASAAENASQLPAYSDRVSSLFQTLTDRLRAVENSIEQFRSSLESRREAVVEIRQTAAAKANQQFREISRLATGSQGELNVMSIDTAVSAYDAGASDSPSTQRRDETTVTATPRAPAGVFSFEELDPWRVRSEAGTLEPSTAFVSDGSQSLHMASYRGDLRTTELAINLDLTDVVRLRYDGYVEANNPNWGDIKIHLDGVPANDEEGMLVSNELINGFPPEDKWYYDIGEDLSSVSGTHLFILWVRGDGNDVYWDNLRFLDASGTPLSPAQLVVE